MRPLDQGDGQFQQPAQCDLLARHLSIIALVVKARQMKNSMQRQNLDFRGRRMSEAGCVLRGDVGGDCDLAGKKPLSAG